jgi:hypothetical protein
LFWRKKSERERERERKHKRKKGRKWRERECQSYEFMNHYLHFPYVFLE